MRAALATITARDPAFNLDAFLAEAQQAFWLVGKAHAECKPELVQTVLAPALAAREKAAIEESCRDHTVAAPKDEDAKSGQLVSINADGNGDTAVIHFVSTWEPVSGNAKAERRVQNWCFQRSAAARTVQLEEGQHCTNCGALLSASAGTCRYCGTAIGTGIGWQVIRIDEVGAQEAADAVAAMRSIVTEVIAARQASRPEPVVAQSAPPRGRRRGGCGPVLLLAVVVVVGVGVGASGGNSTLHRDVAKVLPFLRHPVLSGPLALTGQIKVSGITASQVPPRFQFQGTCAKQVIRTAWDFTAKLPDGSHFALQVGLPPGEGGAGTYQRPKVTISADAQNASTLSSWTAGPFSTAVLSVHSDGGGDLQFKGLAPGATGGSPLAGHLRWSCSLS